MALYLVGTSGWLGAFERVAYADSCPLSLGTVTTLIRAPRIPDTAVNVQSIPAALSARHVPLTRPLEVRLDTEAITRGVGRIPPRLPRRPPLVVYPERPLSRTQRARLRRLLDQRRDTEAIWTLRRAGHEAEARALEASLEARLAGYTAQDILEATVLAGDAGGASETVRIRFRDGTEAYFKAARDYQTGPGAAVANHRAEIAMHRFDQLLSAGAVPTTVEWVYQGRVGSLQVGLPRRTSRNPPGRVARARTRLLDFLAGNPDRHDGNWLLTPAGFIAAIDHGLAFWWGGSESVFVDSLYWELLQTRTDAEITQAQLRLGRTLTPAEQHATAVEVRRSLQELRDTILVMPVSRWTSSPVMLRELGVTGVAAWRDEAMVAIRECVPDLETYQLLQSITPQTIQREVGTLLTWDQIDAVIRRRDSLLRYVDEMRAAGTLAY